MLLQKEITSSRKLGKDLCTCKRDENRRRERSEHGIRYGLRFVTNMLKHGNIQILNYVLLGDVGHLALAATISA